MTRMNHKTCREMNGWYTPENVYCLLRLYQHQKHTGQEIAYSELDVWYDKFLNEIKSTRPNTASMKQKINHDGEDILYSSSEDLHIVLDLFLDERYSGPVAQANLFAFAQGVCDEYTVLGYENECYFTFDEFNEELNRIVSGEEVEDEELYSGNEHKKQTSKVVTLLH